MTMTYFAFNLASSPRAIVKSTNLFLDKWAHKHNNVRTRRMPYLTLFSIPVFLNQMINKMADEASAILLLICLHEVWVKMTYDWSTALSLCLCLCRPRFH